MAISLQAPLISLLLILTLLFFILPTPPPQPPHPHQRSLLSTTTTTTTLINYQNPIFTLPTLILTILLHFYILIKTANDHFSTVVTTLSCLLRLSPSMAAVTLLSLGNGAPDLFSSLAALSSDNPRTGLAATLSAGAFVSGLVVGFIGIYAAPFSVAPSSFVRDVLFYLVAAFFLFYVYLSGELYFWQAIGFVGFYLFFVGFVFWMDMGSRNNHHNNNLDLEAPRKGDVDHNGDVNFGGDRSSKVGILGAFGKISKLWEVPVSVVLKLTIPQTEPSEWSRFYQSANVALCPLALLYSCNSFIPMDHPVMFLLPLMHLPLWFVVLFSSSSLATLHYILEKEPPKTEQMFVVLVAFVMSVFWISNVAKELLSCLAALGTLLNLPPSILGLTVLAWGNSVGDLVADVAVARAGQPALAMAGCFAGPMFNMLVGLGMALVVQTSKVYPEAYNFHFHMSIVVAFVFLFLSLMGSLLVVTWSRFRVPRFWGFCLVCLYAIFIVVSLFIARFST